MELNLSAEQEAMLPDIARDWQSHVLSTEPIDHAEAEDLAAQMYRVSGYISPRRFEWQDSPARPANDGRYVSVQSVLQAAHNSAREFSHDSRMKILRTHPPVTNLPSVTPIIMTGNGLVERTYGLSWTMWPYYFDRLTGRPLRLAVRAVLGLDYWWAYSNRVVLSERPTHIRVTRGQVGSAFGPAIEYPNLKVYFWNGQYVDRKLVTEGWTKQDFLATTAGWRRVGMEIMAERIGWEATCDMLDWPQRGERVADPGNPGQTLSLRAIPSIWDGHGTVGLYTEACTLLICTNATPEPDGTRREFGITVPRFMVSPRGAAAWTFGLQESTYANMLRAC